MLLDELLERLRDMPETAIVLVRGESLTGDLLDIAGVVYESGTVFLDLEADHSDAMMDFALVDVPGQVQ